MLAKFHIFLCFGNKKIKKKKKNPIIFTNVEAVTVKKSKIEICIRFDVLLYKCNNQSLKVHIF